MGRESPAPAPGGNGFAGDPASDGLAAHYEIEVSCVREPDLSIGYVIDIKRVDLAVRSVAVPLIQHAAGNNPRVSPLTLMHEIAAGLRREMGPIAERVRWFLTPTYSIEVPIMSTDNTPGSGAPVLVRQRFDFAASHRLHVPSLSDEENQRLFGKCNHASGHGHNYQIEPCVEVRADSGHGFRLHEFERLVKRVVIDRFDHRHLNLDTTEFASEGGVNPTVENIARVFFSMLEGEIATLSPGSKLRSVTVWETDRTNATYPA